ncbi:ATP-binding protein [Streptomyces sp. ISL-94]|uniref:ATP-binding protein n=1 Tax=Streptomyces sp. ISL-94 TaxID=2819190 RepID=UPI001BED0039|nr:ATP-binding protein [Streptomyces sp. ISL-94]MBT2480894.1 ATP-binding protein [Streptomyces sp. ISL-94]
MDRTQGQTHPQEQSGPANPAAVNPAAVNPPAAAPARIVSLTAGDFTLTVNPVDGSEMAPVRPDTATGRPAKRGPAARSARDAAARPPVLPGAPASAPPLRGREEERERLVRLLARGRSVRLTGPAGSGRTSLLDAVAARCDGLAPDGVVRLSGYGHQQPGELLHALYATVYEASDQRPDRIELLSRIRDIGAVVLLDDLEMGGPALDELLRATPECAYLLAATPETRAPSDDSHLEEVFLGGLGKADCLNLLEAGIGRPLTDLETAWAGDLAFASEGLPLRFVQAVSLLRQRDELNHTDEDGDEEEPGVFEERPRDAVEVPLPTLAEGAAPAELLASRVSESARAALRIACALGGEMPHHAHLPALVGDTHADSAVAELLACGLLTPVGTRYRLAAGVARQLEEAGYGDTAAEGARTAARHYAWWTGHTSVSPERVAAETDAVLAALAGADVVAAVLLARTAAPAFAASLHWEAWERVLRSGAEAARKAGEVAEQAYFHHELGVLALCEGRVDRARAELETSIGLKGALADKRGTVAGRRALALVVDREAAGVAASPPLRLEAPAAGAASAAAGPPALPAALPAGPEAVTTALPAAPRAVPGVTGVVAPGASEAVTRVTPVATGTPVTPGAKGTPGIPGTPVTPGAKGTPGIPGTPVTPISPVVPVIRRPDAPSTLSEVFEDAFPLSPKPAADPVPATRPPYAEPAADSVRRRRILLAGAGVLTVVALGTVVSLAMGSSDTPAPTQGPAVSSTPTRVAPPVVPGASGNDPAPAPSDPAAPSDSAAAEPGATGSAGPTGSTRATPSRKPSATPPSARPSPAKPTPTPPDPGSPAPTPTPTTPPTPTPVPTETTGPQSPTATS